ncbi:MAG: SPOR domain-containing protein [Gemmatimonadaceae bacterium]|nr:SPOR domain-containing protein [Gemmatimonadaceae bacterium]
MDPRGRYLRPRPRGEDSTIVIALGTNRVVGALATQWRADLPFVAPDGGIAVAQAADVFIVDGETLRPVARVRGGSADFWYPFRWTGFRPRAAALDQPVEFAGPSDSARAAQDSAAALSDSVAPPPVAGDTAPRKSAGWTVSFAALLVPERAAELAARIRVGNESARVVTALRDGSTIYRVVLGPYPTRAEAERVGREAKTSFWVYEEGS